MKKLIVCVSRVSTDLGPMLWVTKTTPIPIRQLYWVFTCESGFPGGQSWPYMIIQSPSNVEISYFLWASLSRSITMGFPELIFTSKIHISAFNLLWKHIMTFAMLRVVQVKRDKVFICPTCQGERTCPPKLSYPQRCVCNCHVNGCLKSGGGFCVLLEIHRSNWFSHHYLIYLMIDKNPKLCTAQETENCP